MTRALTGLSLLLALVVTGAAMGSAHGAPDWRTVAPAATPESITAWSPAPAAVVLATGALRPLAIADRNTGPAGRMGPRFSAATPASGAARVLKPLGSPGALDRARFTHRDHYVADALTRAGLPFWRTTAPPLFHSI